MSSAPRYSKHHSATKRRRELAPKNLTILIHTFYATGHVLPMQAVAKVLVDRGHRVIWLTHSDQEPRVRASGAEFLPTSALAAVDTRLQDPNAPQPTTIEQTVEFLLGGRLTAQVADLRRALAHVGGEPPACLLHDALPHGAAALHELGEVPAYATLGVLPMYTSGAREAARSALGTILSTPALVLPCLNRQRAELGLAPLLLGGAAAAGDDDALHYSPLLHVQASSPALEYGQTLANAHFVGPLVTARGAPGEQQAEAPPLPAWWAADVAVHPCVVGITQGTYAVDPATLLVPAIEALCGDEALLLVVPSKFAAGIREALEARELDLTRVRLAEWVPYDVLLPRCRLLVTNGGYGSVTQSLSHGVPMVCAGTSEDKKDTAARMVAVGAGVDLGTDTPTSEQIRAAVKEVLGDEKYRHNAIRVGKELNGLGGAERTCDLLEDMILQQRSGKT